MSRLPQPSDWIVGHPVRPRTPAGPDVPRCVGPGELTTTSARPHCSASFWSALREAAVSLSRSAGHFKRLCLGVDGTHGNCM
eukprot:3184596-Pyramimonas_sp.AAC.1